MENNIKDEDGIKTISKISLYAKNLQEYFDSQDMELDQILNCLGFFIGGLLAYNHIDEEDSRQLFRYIDASKEMIQELIERHKARS